jgi:hypothetical protein
MIYFLVTACVFNNCNIRESQYVRGINALKEHIERLCIRDYKIIIIENNGKRPTYLDTFGCDVYYTNHNSLSTINKGIKELHDIRSCIEAYNIQDDDFIVKMTGRYILNETSEFMNTIACLQYTPYDCVLKYGPYFAPVSYKMNDCITGLIGMRCKYVKQIEMPQVNECVEWKWGKVTYLIHDDHINKVNTLGIQICPGSNEYFSV